MSTATEEVTTAIDELASNARLSGKNLLTHSKRSGASNRRDLAIDCGYYKLDGNGKTRADLTAYLDAVLAASGVSIGDESKRSEAQKLKNGDLSIPASLFATEFPLCDVFTVQVRRGKIILTPSSSDD
jgi:hypothetical protein